jgi:heme-degrading monooxygenase HmoA
MRTSSCWSVFARCRAFCVESARNAEGFGITVSYWANLEAMQRWKADAEHRLMQQQGPRWYENYQVRIAKVEREYGLNPPASE